MVRVLYPYGKIKTYFYIALFFNLVFVNYIILSFCSFYNHVYLGGIGVSLIIIIGQLAEIKIWAAIT